jgi:hypothetical protein
MVVWLPEKIRYNRSVGTAEIICAGCRERIVADVHEKLDSAGRVGRCRLCGFIASLPDSLPLSESNEERFLVSASTPPQAAPFIVVAASPYEVARSGGMVEFTKERAMLAAIAIALKWHRPRVFWSRTIFVIIAAVILDFIVVAVPVARGLALLAYLVTGVLFVGVFQFHRRLIRIRTVAEVKTRVSNFTSHFGVSLKDVVQAGMRDGGDFKMAAQFMRSCFER